MIIYAKNIKYRNSQFFAMLFFMLLLCFMTSMSVKGYASSLSIDSVSVNHENGSVIIAWTLDTDESNGTIEVHRRLISGGYGRIATLPINATNFSDNGANANLMSYSYYIVALDENESTLAVSNTHQTSFMESPVVDVCDKQIFIEWEMYDVTTSYGEPVQLPIPFDQAKIWINTDANNWQMIDIVDTQVNNYQIDVFESGNYCFYVQYLDSNTGITSSSNINCTDAEILEEPEFAYIKNVDVLDADRINIKFFADDNVVNPGYVLWRSSSTTNDYIAVDTVFSESELLTFSDHGDVNTVNNSYLYKVEVLDSCLISNLYSNVANSILLKSNISGKLENEIEWTHYSGWEYGVEKYVIYRKAPQETDFSIIGEVSGNINYFRDYLSLDEISGETSKVHYYVVAVESDANYFGFKSESISNTTFVLREPEVFIPNAFKPKSLIEKNRYFKPEFGFFKPQNYELIILNRWGSVIFNTNDYNSAWDGKINNNIAEAGTYLYIIRWENANGEAFERKGVVNLIK